MLEREQTQPSIWEKLTPDKALELAEKILSGIENGKLKEEIYEPIVDRLINFACDISDPQTEKNMSQTQNPQKHTNPANSKKIHSLNQLPPAEKALYQKRQEVSRSIFKANKDGRVRVKNQKRKH